MAKKSEVTPADAPKKERFGRLRQIGQAYKIASRTDKRLGLYTFGSAGVIMAISILLAVLVGPVVLLRCSWASPLAFLVGTIIFTRRAEAAVYRQIEGQPGAAASALQTLRRGWFVEQAITVNRAARRGAPGDRQARHRACRRGASAPRVKNLLAQEHKRHARLAGSVPITDIIAGKEEGQVPLRKLGRTVQKLPKAISPAEMTETFATDCVPCPRGEPAADAEGPAAEDVELPKGSMPPR